MSGYQHLVMLGQGVAREQQLEWINQNVFKYKGFGFQAEGNDVMTVGLYLDEEDAVAFRLKFPQ